MIEKPAGLVKKAMERVPDYLSGIPELAHGSQHIITEDDSTGEGVNVTNPTALEFTKFQAEYDYESQFGDKDPALAEQILEFGSIALDAFSQPLKTIGTGIGSGIGTFFDEVVIGPGERLKAKTAKRLGCSSEDADFTKMGIEWFGDCLYMSTLPTGWRDGLEPATGGYKGTKAVLEPQKTETTGTGRDVEVAPGKIAHTGGQGTTLVPEVVGPILTSDQTLERLADPYFQTKSELEIFGRAALNMTNDLASIDPESAVPMLQQLTDRLNDRFRRGTAIGLYDTAQIASLLYDPYTAVGPIVSTARKLISAAANRRFRRLMDLEDNIIPINQHWNWIKDWDLETTRRAWDSVAQRTFGIWGERGQAFVNRITYTPRPMQFETLMTDYKFIPFNNAKILETVDDAQAVQTLAIDLSRQGELLTGKDLLHHWDIMTTSMFNISKITKPGKFPNLTEKYSTLLVVDEQGHVVGQVPTKVFKDGGPSRILDYLKERATDYTRFGTDRGRFVMIDGVQLDLFEPVHILTGQAGLDTIRPVVEEISKVIPSLKGVALKEFTEKTASLYQAGRRVLLGRAKEPRSRAEVAEEARLLQDEWIKLTPEMRQAKAYQILHDRPDSISKTFADNVIKAFHLDPELTVSAPTVVWIHDVAIQESLYLSKLAKIARVTGHPDDMHKVVEHHAELISLMDAVVGIRSNIAESLSILQIKNKLDLVSEKKIAVDMVLDFLGTGNRTNPNTYLEKLADIPNPLTTLHASHAARAIGKMEMWVEAMMNGWLSSPITMVVNVASAGFNSVLLHSERSYASWLRHSADYKNIRKVQAVPDVLRESWAEFRSTAQGIMLGFRNAWQFHKTGAPSIGKHSYMDWSTPFDDDVVGATERYLPKITSANLRDMVGNSWIRRNWVSEGLVRLTRGVVPEFMRGGANALFSGVADIGGGFIRFPSKVLGMSDEFIKAMNFQANIARMSTTWALNEIKLNSPHLSWREKSKAYNRILDDVRADPFLQQSFAKKAGPMASEATFTQELGEIGKQWVKFANTHPAFRLLTPFIRTPINLLKWNFHRTPLLQKQFKEYKAGMLSNDPAVRALWKARTHGAYAMMVAGMYLGYEGIIQGRGPRDPHLLNAWKRLHVEDSLNLEGHKPIALSRADPAVVLFGTYADAATFLPLAWEGDPDKPARVRDMMLALFLATVDRMKDKVFFRSANNLFHLAGQSVTNPDQWKTQLAQIGFGQSVPYSGAIRYAAHQVDPIMREVEDFVDMYTANIPAYSKWAMKEFTDDTGYIGYPELVRPGYPVPVRSNVDIYGYPEMYPIGMGPDFGRWLGGDDTDENPADDISSPFTWLFNSMNPLTVKAVNYTPAELKQSRLLETYGIFIQRPENKKHGIQLTPWEQSMYNRVIAKGLERMHQDHDITDDHYTLIKKWLDENREPNEGETVATIRSQYEVIQEVIDSTEDIEIPEADTQEIHDEILQALYEGKQIDKKLQPGKFMLLPFDELPNDHEHSEVLTKQSLISTALSDHRADAFFIIPLLFNHPAYGWAARYNKNTGHDFETKMKTRPSEERTYKYSPKQQLRVN